MCVFSLVCENAFLGVRDCRSLVALVVWKGTSLPIFLRKTGLPLPISLPGGPDRRIFHPLTSLPRRRTSQKNTNTDGKSTFLLYKYRRGRKKTKKSKGNSSFLVLRSVSPSLGGHPAPSVSRCRRREPLTASQTSWPVFLFCSFFFLR